MRSFAHNKWNEENEENEESGKDNGDGGKNDKPGEQIRTNIKYFRVNAERILLS